MPIFIFLKINNQHFYLENPAFSLRDDGGKNDKQRAQKVKSGAKQKHDPFRVKSLHTGEQLHHIAPSLGNGRLCRIHELCILRGTSNHKPQKSKKSFLISVQGFLP